MNPLRQKLGILGGGQLGKMLLPECLKLDIETHILDPDANCPCAAWCTHFTKGDFRDYETVLAFGRQVDVITIEIEQVNVEALEQLEKEGKAVHPSPTALRIIQDKGLQKQFYANNGLPTAPFKLYDSAEQITEQAPYVQKSRQFGYDGNGVAVIRTAADLPKLLQGPCLVEEAANIKKELAVIVAQDARGNVRAFPPVEMVFHPTANLVELLQTPADIPAHIADAAQNLAINTLSAFNLRGVLAVELFWTMDDEIWINEVAPRPHNSGHHTIESCITSQYEQHIRSVMGLPLGATDLVRPAVMVNLLGEAGFSGQVVYEGLETCLAQDGVNVHLYGKKETRPFRKMGHVTITATHLDEALKTARLVQDTLKVKA